MIDDSRSHVEDEDAACDVHNLNCFGWSALLAKPHLKHHPVWKMRAANKKRLSRVVGANYAFEHFPGKFTL